MLLPLPTPLRLSERLSPRRRAPRPRTLSPGSAPQVPQPGDTVRGVAKRVQNLFYFFFLATFLFFYLFFPLQALPEMPGRRRWWARCWLGVCLSLLGAGGCSGGGGGGGGSEPCRLPPCPAEAPPPPCRGARCGARAGRPARSFPHTATPLRAPQGKPQPPAARGGPPEACPAGGCSSNGTRRDCQGLECRLPPRLRPRPRGTGGCGASAPGEGCPEPALLRAAERAAQFAGDDFAYGGPELGGGGALGVQLACDVKPGAGGPRGPGGGGFWGGLLLAPGVWWELPPSEQLRVLSRARGEGLGHGCGARRGCAAPSSPSAHTHRCGCTLMRRQQWMGHGKTGAF